MKLVVPPHIEKEFQKSQREESDIEDAEFQALLEEATLELMQLEEEVLTVDFNAEELTGWVALVPPPVQVVWDLVPVQTRLLVAAVGKNCELVLNELLKQNKN